MTDVRLFMLQAEVARLRRGQRRLLWLLAAVGIVRLILLLEGWALDMSQDQMMRQAVDLLRTGQVAR